MQRSSIAFLCGVVASLGLVAGCSPAAADSGVQGATRVDVGCPVEVDDTPCPTEPIRAAITVKRAADSRVLQTSETADDGRFRLQLAPDTYVLSFKNLRNSPLPHAEDLTVDVKEGEFAEVLVTFDSGVR